MSGALCKFTGKPNASRSGKHAAYITRETGTHGEERAIYLHNLDDLKGIDYRETRTNFISYAEARQDEELAKRKDARTHYRCILSFDRQEDTEKARELAAQFLKENFPEARAAVAIHRDTKNTHAHIWVEARQLDDRKIHLPKNTFRTLDDRWAKIYAREYGEKYEREHLEKKEETRNFKRAKAQGKEHARPERASRPTTAKEHNEREARNYGDNQGDARSDQRADSDREYSIKTAEQEINRRVETSKQADRAVDETISGARELRTEIERMGNHRERLDDHDRNQEKGHTR
jgi:hypothetical protein